MIYCKYKSNTKSTATYSFGALVDDMTGEIVFHFSDGDESAEVTKEPEEYKYYLPRHLQSLYAKHRDEFRAGEFKKKISWEF